MSPPIVEYSESFRKLGGNRDKSRWVVVDAFSSQYYSGLDLSVYMGDTYLDEVVSLQFQVVENVMPYYSYAGYTANFVARGTRIIQGSFSINFKESAYLVQLLRRLRSPKAKTHDSRHIKEALKADVTLEEFLQMANSPSKAQAALKKPGNPQLFNSEWFKVADAFEAALWGGLESPLSTNPKGPLLASEVGGFDIYLKYGQPLTNEGDLKDVKTGKPIYRDVNTAPGTLEKLSGCHITGVGKAVDDSGRNILEVYNFLSTDWGREGP